MIHCITALLTPTLWATSENASSVTNLMVRMRSPDGLVCINSRVSEVRIRFFALCFLCIESFEFASKFIIAEKFAYKSKVPFLSGVSGIFP